MGGKGGRLAHPRNQVGLQRPPSPRRNAVDRAPSAAIAGHQPGPDQHREVPRDCRLRQPRQGDKVRIDAALLREQVLHHRPPGRMAQSLQPKRQRIVPLLVQLQPGRSHAPNLSQYCYIECEFRVKFGLVNPLQRHGSAPEARLLSLLDRAYRPFRQHRPDGMWVFGIQKSGTTVFARALAEATGQTCLLDTPLLWDSWHAPWRAEQLGQLMRRHPVTFSPAIWKEPSATFFPEAALSQTTRKRHILLIREPAANIRSALDQWGVSPTSTTFPAALRRPYVTYFQSFPGPPALAMAQRWNDAHHHGIWTDPSVAVIRYEQFIADPDRILARAAAHLGWPLRHSAAPILQRQHQPAGTNRHRPLEDYFGTDLLGQIRHATAPTYERLLARALP